MQRIAFQIANRRGDPLRGDLRIAGRQRPLPAVVICHGFKGFKDWGFFPYVGERLAEAGFAAVSFNFSGSGIGPDLQNFTELDRFAADTMSQQIDDLECILDALASGEIGAGVADAGRMGVLGHSRGGAAAILSARDDARLRAVVTWAPVSRLMRYSARELQEWRRRGHMEFLNTRTQQVMRVNWASIEDYQANADRFDLPRAVSQLRVPLLVVHGEEDLSVRVEEGRELYAAADTDRAKLVVLPRTGHTFGVEHPWKQTTPALERAVEESVAWLQASLGIVPKGSTA